MQCSGLHGMVGHCEPCHGAKGGGTEYKSLILVTLE